MDIRKGEERVFGWFRTDTEKKRDDYYKLYEKLQDALSEHDSLVGEAESAYASYKNSSPYLSANKIPSNHFSPVLSELEGTLQRYFNEEKNSRSDLVRAKSLAYQQYEHYRTLALREAEEERKNK